MNIVFHPNLRQIMLTLAAAGSITAAAQSVKIVPTTLSKDTFAISAANIPPTGTAEDSIMLYAPSPQIKIQGETKNARIVVKLSTNVLYKYDNNGKAVMAYRVASGKKNTPTKTGVRVVSHVESYPYKSAPEKTRRHRKPWDYGPRVICLETLDPETGKKGSTGQFIHGNHNPASIGKYASLGCVRMDNTIIKALASEVKRGDIVIIEE